MIVNPAYIHMGESQPAINPVIFANGVVNYPYTLTSGTATWEPSVNRFYIYEGGSVTFTLPLKKIKSITFTAERKFSAASVSISIPGAAGTTQTYSVLNRIDIVYSIPDQWQLNDTKIQVKCTGGPNVSLYGGTMNL